MPPEARQWPERVKEYKFLFLEPGIEPGSSGWRANTLSLSYGLLTIHTANITKLSQRGTPLPTLEVNENKPKSEAINSRT